MTMSLRSPLGRVRGLGSAKEGTGHFWAQRVTAVALVPLTFLFVVLLFVLIGKGADHAGMVAIMGNPLWAIIMLSFIVAGFYHMMLGMQVVIEDYIIHEGAKTALILIVDLGSIALGIACVFAILKLAFGG